MKLTEETYVNLAEKVINELSRSKKIVRGREQPIKLITTSKIRNLLAIMMDIKNDILESGTETLTPELAGRIQYLKVKYILMHYSGLISPEQRIILSMQL